MNSNQQQEPDRSAEAGGQVELGMQSVKFRGIRPSDMRWIVGAASFTIVMLGIRFAAQAIADILNAIKP